MPSAIPTPLHANHQSDSQEIILNEHQDLMALWCLRILVRLGGYKGLVSNHRFGGGDVLRLVGLGDIDEELPKKVLLEILAGKLKTLEKRRITASGVLRNNLDSLAKTLGFSSTEVDILEFAVLLRGHQTLEDAVGLVGNELSAGNVLQALAVIINRPRREVLAALHPESALLASGILHLNNHSHSRGLDNRLVVISGMVDALSIEQPDPLALLERFFREAPEPQLTGQDFAHIRRDYQLLAGYLKNVILYGTEGVNLLIYGVPGTGKTELVRTLAAETGLQLFEINAQKDGEDSFDLDYRPSTFRDRFSTYQLSQSVLGANVIACSCSMRSKTYSRSLETQCSGRRPHSWDRRPGQTGCWRPTGYPPSG